MAPRANKPEDIWKKILVGSADECWPFTGFTNWKGYGRFRIKGEEFQAHRVAFHLAVGDPTGFLVCHHCDNPPCCNPSHLFLGTPLDNTRDMVAKGRNAPQHGVLNPAAKLNDDQVAEIRSRRSNGETTIALSAEFGVSHSRISQLTIQSYGAWRQA